MFEPSDSECVYHLLICIEEKSWVSASTESNASLAKMDAGYLLEALGVYSPSSPVFKMITDTKPPYSFRMDMCLRLFSTALIGTQSCAPGVTLLTLVEAAWRTADL